MKVYIPFDDGSSVSFDGKSFELHRRPMDLNEDLRTPVTCKAEQMWKSNWDKIVQALQSAWNKKHDAHYNAKARSVYSPSRKTTD